MGDIETAEAPAQPDDDGAAGAVAPPVPPPPVDIGGWPTWLRRTVIGLVMVVAIGVAAWGAQGARSGGGDEKLNDAIVSLEPLDGAQALRQTSVGTELAPGYDGRLTVNGIAIPEGQMDGAIDPASVSSQDLESNGVRPNSRNRVFFTPGPGKVIEEYDTGTVNISVRYFEERQESTTTGTVTWEIRVD